MAQPTSPEAPDLTIPLLIMQRMNSDTAFTTNALLDGYRADIQARDEAIAFALNRLDDLLGGDYMPSPWAIERALMPLRTFGPEGMRGSFREFQFGGAE